MALLSLSKVDKNFGADRLLGGVSFQVEENDKIGLIGVNGAGKTTLFKILLGIMPKDGGEIHIGKNTNIGYLQQNFSSSGNTVYEEVLSVYADVIKTEKELTQATFEIGHSGATPYLIDKQHELSEKFKDMGGYTYKNMVKASLIGLGFTENELNLKMSDLSGGQQTRVHLCKILLGDFNLLLLDEPTNHLDIPAVEWLESFLCDYKGAFIVISHDRYFLDKVTNKIFELNNGTITIFPGNYSYYIEGKDLKDLTETRKYNNTIREINRLEGIIKQQRQWNKEKNIKTAESKQKVLDKLEQTLVKPQSEADTIKFKFKVKKSSGNDVLECKDLSMGFDQKELFHGLNLFIKKQDRVFLLGPNGCGKTTLFRLIMGQLQSKGGQIKLGSNVNIGYYDQAQQNLDQSKTAFDEIYDAYPSMTQTEIRNAMAAFLFREDDVFKTISTLSGGEKARIALIKLMLSGADFLLLDEPTNHLDITSREALEDALLSYDGTLFVISHDRYFINKISDKIFYMTFDSLKTFDGNYDVFINNTNEKKQESKSSGKQDYLQQKELEAAKRKKQNDIAKTEKEIAEAEEKMSVLEEKLNMPEYSADYLKAMEVTNEIDNLNETLLALYEKWEELSG